MDLLSIFKVVGGATIGAFLGVWLVSSTNVAQKLSTAFFSTARKACLMEVRPLSDIKIKGRTAMSATVKKNTGQKV